MVFILNLVESLLYCVIKYLIISIILCVAVYKGFVYIRKLLLNGKISSDGKAVLITGEVMIGEPLKYIFNGLSLGCDSGFGNRLAQRLSEMGFKVYATVLSKTSEGAQHLQTNPDFVDKIIVLQMDVTNDPEVKEVYEKVKQDLQTCGQVLWAVVNNAGILSPSLLEWGTLDTYRSTFDINVFGVVRVTEVFLPLIKASKGMKISLNF